MALVRMLTSRYHAAPGDPAEHRESAASYHVGMARPGGGLEIGTRLWIAPEGTRGEVGARLPIVIARGAFGSGEHETTASCLALLETLPDLAGAHVLDLGSGTGILAAAALVLGAASATCIDPDARACAACLRTAELNGLAARIEVVEGVLADLPEQRFDLVLANVYADVLIAEAARVLSQVRPGAALILAGIAWEQVWDVRQRYLAAGARACRERWLGEYVTLLLRAPG